MNLFFYIKLHIKAAWIIIITTTKVVTFYTNIIDYTGLNCFGVDALLMWTKLDYYDADIL